MVEGTTNEKKGTALEVRRGMAELEEKIEEIRELNAKNGRTLWVREVAAFEFSEGVRRIRRHAEANNLSFEDAMLELAEELPPLPESAYRATDSEDAALDRKARRYAAEHGVGYAKALSTVMGREATVELTEGVPETPPTDAEEARRDERAGEELEGVEDEHDQLARSVRVAKSAVGEFERMLEKVRERYPDAQERVHRRRYSELYRELEQLRAKGDEAAEELKKVL